MRLSTLALPVLLAGAALAGDLDTPSSAELCGRCHRAIHEAWKLSAHARSMESRLFQDALDLAEQNFGVPTRKVCLECHSPVAARIGDFGLQRKVSWEGVTCDYCHSITEVAFNGSNPKAKVEFTMVKSGPLKDASSGGHGTVFSAVHTSSLTCAPCHEYKNSLGFPLLTTFSEWKNSRYGREEKACQSCHMSRVAGEVVDPRIQRSSEAKINLHQMPGGHSADQLASTIKATLNAVREGGHVRVTVDVSNQKAGHYVPTGSPMRRLVMELRVNSYDGKHYREERVYHRVVADQQGNKLDREDLAFVKAAKVLSDTRLAPDEKRSEVFTFPVPAGTAAQVEAVFRYDHSPMARTESQKQVTFLRLQRLVR